MGSSKDMLVDYKYFVRIYTGFIMERNITRSMILQLTWASDIVAQACN